jgi:hypothetical protein
LSQVLYENFGSAVFLCFGICGRRLRDHKSTEKDPDDPALAKEGDIQMEYSFDYFQSDHTYEQ